MITQKEMNKDKFKDLDKKLMVEVFYGVLNVKNFRTWYFTMSMKFQENQAQLVPRQRLFLNLKSC